MTSSSTMQAAATGHDVIRKELARIWQQLLGIETVGFDENYFDLGGESAMAVQMFARIDETFHVKLPLATLFDAPTIDELARIVTGEVASTGWSPLVAIQPCGQRPPFFCMHPHGGGVLIYRELSQYLGSDQPFYGLQSRGLDGSCEPLQTIEEMAALYISEMRRLQPHGPYLVGGYCMGGTIAFEVAQQLQQAGEQVALLALFDTINWAEAKFPSSWEKTCYNAERFYFHACNLNALELPRRVEFIREKLNAVRNRTHVRLSTGYFNALAHGNGRGSETLALGRIWKANLDACANYRPKPYPGPVVDFRPTGQFHALTKPNLKWERLALGGQETVELPVNAPGMLVDPFVRHLAAALARTIDRTLAGG